MMSRTKLPPTDSRMQLPSLRSIPFVRTGAMHKLGSNSTGIQLLCIWLSCWLNCGTLLAQSSNSVQQAEPKQAGIDQRQSDELANSVKSSSLSQFDANAAFEFLKKVCEFGPRPSGSQGMKRQQELLQEHFKQNTGGEVFHQNFTVRHPNDGRQIEMKNLLVRWHPERKKRLLICCHYDTRPFPDRDPVNPRGVFIGANDGASGVGLMCELGKHVAALEGKYGVDFIFFDGEEFVFVSRRDEMFLGSTFFARAYSQGQVQADYKAGVLVDMVADKNLQIHYEGNSLKKAPRVTRHLWQIAGQLGIKEFVAKRRHTIRDDHLPLNQIARIPVCDIIDFDFPVDGNGYWHTQQDIVANCSAESLGKVGKVVLQWLREMQTR